MSLILGQTSVNALRPILVADDGSIDVNITGGGGGDATAANQELQLAQQTLTATDVVLMNAKITKGSDTTLVEAQQTLSYGCDFNGDLRPLKVGSTGRLIVEVDGLRSSGSQLGWTIPNNTTGVSTEIPMTTHTRIAFYGDTDNTFNENFFIEYSPDGTNWFRGSGDNAKVIIISATGNFYDEEQITPPQVRLSRTNNSGALETINLYWTQL